MSTVIADHIVPQLDEAMRLQEYGIGIFLTITTKSALKKAIKKQLILVNGTMGTTGIFIRGGELIQLKEATENRNAKRVVLDLNVIYEDEYLACILKPAGIAVSGNRFFTIANALEQNLKRSTVADSVVPKPVHRLDYPTTGVVLVGKTSWAIIRLNRLFETKQVQKVYYAVTIGAMKATGRVAVPIDGKAAVSVYNVEQTLVSKRFGYLNLVRLSPETGRTHQLRKHLAAMGNPILGDAEYGTAGLVLQGKGLYLHAYSLEFMHPVTQRVIVLKSELPKKFLKLFPS